MECCDSCSCPDAGVSHPGPFACRERFRAASCVLNRHPVAAGRLQILVASGFRPENDVGGRRSTRQRGARVRRNYSYTLYMNHFHSHSVICMPIFNVTISWKLISDSFIKKEPIPCPLKRKPASICGKPLGISCY